ncbi:MAG: hypothetical protein Q4F32_07335, partial [Eubacteriales bacterium]|nr:hypothetical protein [Eubacteriales bacterium]
NTSLFQDTEQNRTEAEHALIPDGFGCYSRLIGNPIPDQPERQHERTLQHLIPYTRQIAGGRNPAAFCLQSFS